MEIKREEIQCGEGTANLEKEEEAFSAWETLEDSACAVPEVEGLMASTEGTFDEIRVLVLL